MDYVPKLCKSAGKSLLPAAGKKEEIWEIRSFLQALPTVTDYAEKFYFVPHSVFLQRQEESAETEKRQRDQKTVFCSIFKSNC